MGATGIAACCAECSAVKVLKKVCYCDVESCHSVNTRCSAARALDVEMFTGLLMGFLLFRTVNPDFRPSDLRVFDCR